MYKPLFRMKRNGVPILSGKEINIIGERFVQDFQPEVLRAPAAVDIESFIESYLGMTPDYQYLSHNGIYLGMTIFNDTDRVVVYSPQTERAEYISARARTVIIDNRLLEENQEHRYRFTLGHEGGHDILHSGYYSYDPNQLSIVGAQPEPMVQCRVDCQSIRKPFDHWDDHDRMEWQANRLSAAILMPESAVRLIASDYDPVVLQSNPVALDHLVIEIANAFNVSMEAATYRLKDLGILKKDSPCGHYSTAAADFSQLVGN